MSVHSFSLLDSLDLGNVESRANPEQKGCAGLSRYLVEYADEQDVYMKINFVNAEHVHALIDLPTGFSIEKVVQLLKEVLPTG